MFASRSGGEVSRQNSQDKSKTFLFSIRRPITQSAFWYLFFSTTHLPHRWYLLLFCCTRRAQTSLRTTFWHHVQFLETKQLDISIQDWNIWREQMRRSRCVLPSLFARRVMLQMCIEFIGWSVKTYGKFTLRLQRSYEWLHGKYPANLLRGTARNRTAAE